MRGRSRVALFPLLLALSGCGESDDNPFLGVGETRAPNASAEIVFVSSAWSTDPAAGRELYAIRADGSGLERLTSFNQARLTDVAEAAFGVEREKAILRRVQDRNGDGRLDAATDGTAMAVIDLARAVDRELLAANWRVESVEWSPNGGFVLHTAVTPASGLEDLFVSEPNGANREALTQTLSARERRARTDPGGTVAIYERIEGSAPSAIYFYLSSANQIPLTTGGTPGELLAGTPYRVGSDADPDFSSRSDAIVFRRLTSTAGGTGHWDLMRFTLQTEQVTPIVTGPRFRGAPDWGPKGIVYTELDPTTRQPSLVLIQPDGTGRTVLATFPAGTRLDYPRWLP
jgi:hypothetical protein